MTEKRFTETLSTGIVTDNVTGKEYKCEMRIDDELLGVMNNLHKENQSWKQSFDLINKVRKELIEENEQLKKQVTSLKVELDTHKHPLWSTREAERKVSELTDLLSNETKKNAILLEEINSLRKENMRLKEVQKYG